MIRSRVGSAVDDLDRAERWHLRESADVWIDARRLRPNGLVHEDRATMAAVTCRLAHERPMPG